MNAARAVSPITRVNKALAKLGREERLVRGRGYYYLTGGESAAWYSSSIYAARLDRFEFAASEVEQVYAAAGITIAIPRT